jgi:hypothetical protein
MLFLFCILILPLDFVLTTAYYLVQSRIMSVLVEARALVVAVQTIVVTAVLAGHLTQYA